MSTIDLERLAAHIATISSDTPTLTCIDECISRDAKGIDPTANEDTSLNFIADGDRLAKYVQARYVERLAQIHPEEAPDVLRKMSHLKDVAERLIEVVPSGPDSDAKMLADAAEEASDVGA